MSLTITDTPVDKTTDLHFSYSQLSTYLRCPLRYYFQYVRREPWERKSANLAFGSAFHKAAAAYYEGLVEDGEPLPESIAVDIFRREWDKAQQSDLELVFNKRDSAESLAEKGEELIHLLYDNEEEEKREILGVEVTFAAPLTDPDTGEDLHPGMKLVGIVDLVTQTPDGDLQIVDHKTSSRSWSESRINSSHQVSSYAHLAAESGLVERPEDASINFDVFIKTKTPKRERYETARTTDDVARFTKLSASVLDAIDKGVFYPVRGWQCRDCAFRDRCGQWHRN